MGTTHHEATRYAPREAERLYESRQGLAKTSPRETSTVPLLIHVRFESCHNALLTHVDNDSTSPYEYGLDRSTRLAHDLDNDPMPPSLRLGFTQLERLGIGFYSKHTKKKRGKSPV